MKKSSIYTMQESTLKFINSGNSMKISPEIQVEVSIKPVRKAIKGEILNTIVNAASSSIANGNELVNIYVNVISPDGEKEILLLNDKPLIRNNLEYHEMIKHARKLQESLINDCNKT